MQGRLLALSVAALVGLFATEEAAQAEYIVTLTQQGGGVVANGSGTIDLTDLMLTGHAIGEVASMVPNVGIILTGPTVGTAVDSYGFFTGPTSFGSGTSALASSGSGDLVGILADVEQTLFLPSGYVSGTPLSDTSTYAGQTFASLGVTPGTYTWTWGTGKDADSAVLNIGVPEPSSALVLLSALAGLLGLRMSRARRV